LGGKTHGLKRRRGGRKKKRKEVACWITSYSRLIGCKGKGGRELGFGAGGGKGGEKKEGKRAKSSSLATRQTRPLGGREKTSKVFPKAQQR